MKKKTKILVIIGAIIAVFILGGVIAFQIIQRNLDNIANTEIAAVPMEQVEDGVYTGDFGVFPVVAQVEVTVKDHQIVSARILKHQNGQGSAGEAVVKRAVTNQSLQVDAVAGATYSSKVLLLAMGNALQKGIPR